jgi:hypothetical protein
MIPPLMSSTMGSEDILSLKGSSSNNKTQNNSGSLGSGTTKASNGEAGRPEKPDD